MTDGKKDTLRFAAVGALAGLVNGFFGGGGGMALVPLLEKLCGVRGRRAFATCVCVILPLCAVSATIYALRAGIDLAATAPYLAGGLAGGALAGRLLPRVPVKWLRLLLAGFMLYGGARALLWS